MPKVYIMLSWKQSFHFAQFNQVSLATLFAFSEFLNLQANENELGIIGHISES